MNTFSFRVTNRLLLLTLLIGCLSVSCKKKNDEEESPSPVNAPDVQNTYGYGILSKLNGIWNGPVTSTTPLGGYPEWIVDFRPVSENQVSAKNELDTLNDIHMSFFIALYNNEYRVAFRNGGSFNGQKRTAYFLADSVSESGNSSFYRFTEILNGKRRAYTDIIFSNDSLYMKVYTNHYNTLPAATPHMVWSAKLQDHTSAAPAIGYFDFPKKSMTRNFSSTFSGLTESIYYTLAGDPYPESGQPYLGQTTVNYSYSAGYTPDPNKKVILVVMTQPLFSGGIPLPANLKYRSRYVVLSSDDTGFLFNYMHPGTYYLYAFYDNDGNGTINSGDWISTGNSTFTLGDQGTVNASAQINLTIP